MDKRVYVFIDASNLWAVQKSKKFLIDLRKLAKYLKDNFSQDLRIFYYDAYPEEGTRQYSVDGKFRFYTFLQKGLGFTVRRKPLKQIHNVINGVDSIFEKGNMDVEIAVDVVNFVKQYDELILFSGDSDFLALLNFAKRNNKRTTVFSSHNNIAYELRTGSNRYIDILDIDGDIWGKELYHRAKQ